MVQQRIRSTSIFAFVVFAVLTGNLALASGTSGPNSATESVASQGERSGCMSPVAILPKGAPHVLKPIYADDSIYVTNCQNMIVNTPIDLVHQHRNYASFSF